MIGQNSNPSQGSVMPVRVGQMETDGLSVIVLDDDKIDQARVRRVVEKSGMPIACRYVSDMDEFSEKLDSQVFDMAFLDYHLVGSNGLDAIRVLREHGTNCETPAIMISSDAPTELVVRAMRSGCSGYLPKDELTEINLGKAINLALQDLARHQFDDFTQYHIRRATKKILDGVVDVCEQELRSSTNRIFRTVNFLRECQAQGYQADPATYNLLEGECMKITHFLEELDQHRNTWISSRPLVQ